MCGGGMTVATLEKLLDLLNKNGCCLVTNCGESSLLELGACLAEMAKQK
jgi:hypothetical protein